MDIFLFAAGALGFLAVALGAFGAHALRATLSPEQFEIFRTAANYQMLHALAIAGTAILLRLQPSNRWIRRSAIFFLVGTVIFSGSLYTLVFSGVSLWGAVTPIGGICLLVAWAFLAVGARAPKA